MARTEYTSKQFCTYLDAEKAWEVIEYKLMGYDRDIDELYPEHFLVEKQMIAQQELLSKLLMSGEQFKILENEYSGYALTSNGRVFNTKSGNQIVVYFKKDQIVVSIRSNRINLATEFMKYGWSFNIDEVKRLYEKNKWKHLWGIKKINY